MTLVGSATSRAWGLTLIVLVGCSTYTKQLTQIRQAYYANDLVAAGELVDARLKKQRGDADVLQLERAMIDLTAGRADEAEQRLRQVRDQFDQLEQQNAAEVSLSYLTDDQRRAYAGEDYEKILLRALLSLSNLMHDGSDAEAYCLQMIAKQEQIIAAGAPLQTDQPNPKATYPRVALAPYLQGVLREATHRDYEDAERSYAAVVSWQPDFAPAQNDLQRAVYGRHSAQGHGVLYVFTLVGRGPYKEEVVEVPSSQALLIAGQLVSYFGEQTVPPNIAPVKVPRVVARLNRVQSVSVVVDGQPAGFTQTITDVSSLAVHQDLAVRTEVVARAVARRILKKGVVYGAKEMAEMTKGSLSGVALDLAGVAWEATESADTRCWGLLPDKIQVMRVELPAGSHDLRLAAAQDNGMVSANMVSQTIHVADGRNTYVLAAFPDEQLVGEVLVSQP